MNGNGQFRHNVEDVLTHARNRWSEILATVAGIPRESLDRKHHPCPRCRGTDRFRFIDPDKGACLCNACFNKSNGDGFAAVAWMLGKSRGEAIDAVGDYLGLAPRNGAAERVVTDPLDMLCRSKRMPRESALAYGARVDGEAVVFPMFGPDGEQCSEFTICPSGGDKARKGLCAKGKPSGVFRPVVDGKPRVPQPGETWLIVEGVKDAAALHALGFLVIGLPTCKLSKKFARLLRGVHVVFVPDRDSAGVVGAESGASLLYGVAANSHIAALPGEVKPKDGIDCRDVLAMEDGEALLREAISLATAWEPPADETGRVDNRPRILAGPREHEVADKAIAALAELPGLYQRGGALTSIVRDPEPPAGIIRPTGSLYITQVDEAGILDRLSQAARFVQFSKVGENEAEREVPPPMRIARIIQSRKCYPGVPTIEGILHAPAFLADGSVLATRGYDRRTGLFLAGRANFPAVQESPTKSDAEVARDELLEVVCDFPFASESHRSAWLALALTPAARFGFDGPVPLGCFDANVRGSGKSKLADSIGMIHLGADLPRTAYPESDEELRKTITATLLAGERMMLLDNVARMLGGPALDALLTATGWNERILGVSKLTGRLAATTQWFASGNNLVYAADTARRTLACRLESPEENPEERSGFRHADLLGFVRQNHARLAVAAVTILRAYHVAGRPSMGLTEWGSFEGWSRLVRHAVVWLGMEDPGATRQEVRDQSDREAGLLRQMISAWENADPGAFGMTASEAIGKASDGNQLLQAVFAEIGTPGKPPNSRSVGMKLHHLRGRVSGGRYFDRLSGKNHTILWRVETTGTKGTEGTKANPLRAHAGAHAHTRETAATAGCSPLTTPSPLGADCEEVCEWR